MECKNCNHLLKTDYSFCANCGAKIIRNRLTFINLRNDIVEKYFNLDNTFLKTFWHLFSKPEVVIGGYINGLRRKYLNPISYLTIALTLSGILLFLLKEVFDDKIDWSILSEENPAFSIKWKEITFDYSSLFYLMYIPILAIAGYLSFNKIKYNLSEYFTLYIYVLAQYSILSFPISLITLLVAPNYYLQLGVPFMIFILVYSIYVMQKTNKYKPKGFIGKSLLYNLLAVLGYLIFIIGLMVIFFITGVFDLQDFAAPK